tara:strand:- start:310 stop:555 length:246 start_codon:yes stop_codon:yes gene_type:complete
MSYDVELFKHQSAIDEIINYILQNNAYKGLDKYEKTDHLKGIESILVRYKMMDTKEPLKLRTKEKKVNMQDFAAKLFGGIK